MSLPRLRHELVSINLAASQTRMAKHDGIISIRLEVDPIRQPRHAPNLARFLSSLSTLKVSERDPYQLCDAAFRLLFADADFAVCPPGSPATVTRDAQGANDYWYRISGIKKVVKNTGPRLLDRDDNDAANWTILWTDFEQEKQWLPLSRYASGDLTGPRGFTWWGPINPIPEVVCSSHKVGLLSEWVTYHTIVMRLKSSELIGASAASVPTIIHGFDSLIFHSTKDKDQPPTGLALNLDLDPLEVEHTEIVVHPIPVSLIECVPVAVDDAPRQKHQVTYDSVLAPLHNYYQKLQQESQ